MKTLAHAFTVFVRSAVAPSAPNESVAAVLAGGWAKAEAASEVRGSLRWHTLSVVPDRSTDHRRDDQVLEGGLVNVRCSTGAFSAAMLTADAGTPISNRHNVLLATGHMLANGGILVLAAEVAALTGQEGDKLVEALLRRCELTAHGMAGSGDVLAVFRKTQEQARHVSRTDVQTFQAQLLASRYGMEVRERLKAPAVPLGARIEATTVSEEWARERARTSGLWGADGSFPDQVEPARLLTPLMPLRRGHLALAIAGGVFGTIALETDEAQLLVKGQHAKREHLEEDGAELKVSRETFAFRLGVLDPRDGTWTMLE